MKELKSEQNTASGIMSVYKQSTGSIVQLFDCNFRHVEIDGEQGIEQNICQYCTGSNGSHHCRELHINAIQEAGRNGRPNIYRCELGLLFWACPIFSDGKFSGALRGSGFLDDKLGIFNFTGRCNTLCNGTVPPEQFTRRVLAFPFGKAGKILSLAEILLLCAESLSTGSESYHESLRLRSDQQASLSAQIEKLKTQGADLPGYPLEKERQLIAVLRRGNKTEADKLLDEVLASLILSNTAPDTETSQSSDRKSAATSPSNFRHIQLRALELAVLFTRTGANFGSNTAIENNVRNIRQIQDAKTVEELAFILHSMVDRISLQIVSFQGIPHASAMRKAENFIRENLTRKISLREIAGIAGLSAPYFSTIFKEEMGENLSRYINRLRVEKASRMLLETNLSLSEIAGECCFEDQSWFSKIFKSFTGISPGKYRSHGRNMTACI